MLKNLRNHINKKSRSIEFMDDSNWIAHSKEDLETILQVADEFYSITKTAINKNKSQLITNDLLAPSLIPINFGPSVINIKPEFSSIRFLGVWINIFNSPSFVTKQVKDT